MKRAGVTTIAMEVKRGIAVSPGVAIGPAMVLDAEGFRIPKRFVQVDAVISEVRRLQHALDKARDEALANEKLLSDKLGGEYGAIFGAHAQMIADQKLRREIVALIEDRNFTPEYATSQVLRRYAKIFEASGPAAAAHVRDIFDVEHRILRHLLGEQREELSHLTAPVIVLAADLTPSETASLDPKLVRAFATEEGGRTSHTAILAGALEIPAVVGLGRFLSEVSGGDTVVIDGNRGLVVLNPDEKTLAEYQHTEEEFRHFEESLAALRDLPAETLDGERIALLGNIEFPDEAEHCLARGAEGIGLYRTEFLYLDSQRAPTEHEHFEAYSKVVKTMNGRPVVIRTLDLGADKLPGDLHPEERERNPFLGLRSLRLCLKHLDLFKTQLRAALRASALGPVSIMFPLVSTLLELRHAKMIVADVMEDLDERGVPFARNIAMGIMIEVPSAVILADQFAAVADFFSLGTNDLIQYTLAVDRNNQSVANLFSAADPAVLRLIRMLIKSAKRHNMPLSVCGEMSADPIFTLLLVGLGVRRLSVTPHSIPEIKKVVRSIRVSDAVKVCRKVMTIDNARDAVNYLRGEARKIIPELVG
jgi:phosphotransferase system enzyme I (PtsI)